MRVALTLVLLLVWSGVAEADRAKALMYFRAGEKAYRAQNFEAAATNFDEAFKVLPLPEVAFSAAQAFRRAHRVQANPAYVRRAIELYRFYLDAIKTGGRVGDAADRLESMQRELERLGAAAMPRVVVEERTRLGVTVSLADERTGEAMREVDDAELGAPKLEIRTTIDGKPVEPDTLHEVEPGDRMIRVEAAGFAPAEQRVTAVEGNSDLIPIELQPLPARVTVKAERGARVRIDGRDVARGQPAELPAGRHVITVVRAGRRGVARTLVVGRGQVVTVAQPLERTLRRRVAPWVLGVAGVAGVLTMSAGLGAVHQDGVASDRLAELRAGNQPVSVLRDYETARDRRERMVRGTWIAGGLAVGLGLAAAALYYFDTPSIEGIRVTPIASDGIGGAVITGGF